MKNRRLEKGQFANPQDNNLWKNLLADTGIIVIVHRNPYTEIHRTIPMKTDRAIYWPQTHVRGGAR
jgi:hypothetical protein